MIQFTAIGTEIVQASNGGPVAAFEITNLTGRVIARTVDASGANRTGAIAHAEKNMGSCYGIDADGNRVETVSA
jgi:hypothetical protein